MIMCSWTGLSRKLKIVSVFHRSSRKICRSFCRALKWLSLLHHLWFFTDVEKFVDIFGNLSKYIKTSYCRAFCRASEETISVFDDHIRTIVDEIVEPFMNLKMNVSVFKGDSNICSNSCRTIFNLCDSKASSCRLFIEGMSTKIFDDCRRISTRRIRRMTWRHVSRAIRQTICRHNPWVSTFSAVIKNGQIQFFHLKLEKNCVKVILL